MRLILLTIAVALLVGALAGGSLRDFPVVRIRWWGLALAGVALQLVVVRGAWAFWVLEISFVLLVTFVVANLRAPGFALILIGLALNAIVITANQGMPVTRHAIEASGQHGTLGELLSNGDGQKHFLAGHGTVLLPLGDVIAIPRPIGQAVSIGDLFVHLGVAWFIVLGMRRQAEPDPEPHPATVKT